jgi:hypothetical protein
MTGQARLLRMPPTSDLSSTDGRALCALTIR